VEAREAMMQSMGTDLALAAAGVGPAATPTRRRRSAKASVR